MHTTRRETPPARRSGDRAERRARTRQLGFVAAAVAILATVLVARWWLERQTPSRDGAPSWAPDGATIVFAAETSPGDTGLFRMNVDGSGRERLTRSSLGHWAPAVSPDGTRVAFEGEHDGNRDVYVLHLGTRQVTRLTNHPARDSAPAWSPDGRRIVFTSDRDNADGADVYVMDADGTATQRVTTGWKASTPQFSPDGRRLAVQAVSDVHVIDLSSGINTRLTVDPRNGMAPVWSPDGSRLAFVTTRNQRAEIFIMNPDGSDQRLLMTMAHGDVGEPRWSPDGARIAFVWTSTAPPDEVGAAQAIYVVSIDSGVVTRLSR